MKLQELDVTKVNNFDAIRFFAATAVVFSHAYLVAGSFASEPLNEFATFINFGSLSVYIFFVISGYLITQSLEKNYDLKAFIAARALRIFPGLAVCILFTGLLLIPLSINQSVLNNISKSEVHSFLLSNIFFPGTSQNISNVYSSNPYPQVINSSLWTLSWELLMYGAVFLVGIIKICIYRKNQKLDLKTIGFTIIYLTITFLLLGKVTKSGLQLVFFFALGMLAFYNRKHIPIRHSAMFCVSLAACLFVLFKISGFKIVFSLALAYAVFYFSFHPSVQLGKFGKYGDFSYGLYIYSFPIQQALIFNLPGITPPLLFTLSFFASLPLAISSWKFVEKPALLLKRKYSSQLVNNHAT